MNIKGKLSLIHLQETFLPKYFLMLQIAFAVKQLIITYIVTNYSRMKKKDKTIEEIDSNT